MLAIAVEAITTFFTVAGLGYYLLVLWSARDFSRRARRIHSKEAPVDLSLYPPVSILKPVKGIDVEMYHSFVTHCRQEYPGSFEILFTAGSMEDPAVPAVKQLQGEFPFLPIRLIIPTERLGASPKVSNLAQTLPYASGEIILINDSDIMVSPHYLRNIAEEFATTDSSGRKVGMVTALYRGRAHTTAGSKMEALGISTDFVGGVLTARKLEGGIHFALGSTLAISREALDAIGGLTPLVNYLADDYEMGIRTARAGYRVEILNEVVETSIPAYTFRAFMAHQLRWGRTIRDALKRNYLGVIFTFGLPWACLNVIASGASLESMALFCLTLLARIAVAFGLGVGIASDQQVVRDWLWILPRDLLAMLIWVWSYAGDTVHWRGNDYVLKNGILYSAKV